MEIFNIQIPTGFIPERTYITQLIFKEFLGLQYNLTVSHEDSEFYKIELGGKYIIIADDFFGSFKENENYLKLENIPEKVINLKHPLAVEANIPIIFGTGKYLHLANEIHCGIDLFASIYFMVTRWEELVVKKRDYLGRFPAEESLAFKHGFLHRPVVNEWVGMLKNMIHILWPELEMPASNKFEIIFTHDIDLMSKPIGFREFAKDLIKRKSPSAFFKRTGYLLSAENPYDMFDYFMDMSERNNTLSRFYFMTGHQIPNRDGEPYNNKLIYKKALQRIKARGHIIGFHPSLNTYNDPALFNTQKRQLEEDSGLVIEEGRQHALRFELPLTWQIWESAGMKLDSTMGYSAQEGFRCGTGNTFTIFDVINKSKLHLMERPLVVMDTTLQVNRKLPVTASASILSNFIEVAKKYDMPLTLLFHNLFKDEIDWMGWSDLYSSLFENH